MLTHMTRDVSRTPMTSTSTSPSLISRAHSALRSTFDQLAEHAPHTGREPNAQANLEEMTSLIFFSSTRRVDSDLKFLLCISVTEVADPTVPAWDMYDDTPRNQLEQPMKRR